MSGVSQLLGGEAVATMTEQDMFAMAKKLLMASGYDINSLLAGKNYDGGSAYTEPNNAWDMNRITKLLNEGKVKLETEEVAALKKAADEAKKSSLATMSEQGAAFLPKGQTNPIQETDKQDKQEAEKMQAMQAMQAMQKSFNMPNTMPSDAEFEQKIKEAEEMLKAQQN